MTDYRIVPEASTVTAVLRPALDGRGRLHATISGDLAIVDAGDRPVIHGTVRLELAEPVARLELDVTATGPELDRGRDGELLLRGSATRPAATVGLTGPPLLNPTVVLRWRAVLEPTG